MLDHVFTDAIGALRDAFETARLERTAFEERFWVDVLLGDLNWQTSYGLPGEGLPPRVQADVSCSWPTWSQSAYRSWYVTEELSEPPRIEIEIEFDRAVVAADDAEIIVAVGGDVGTYTQDVAAYVSGSGTDTLTFAYTVRDSRSDPDGITVRLRAGQDITDADTGDAYSVRHPAAVSYLGPASGHKIDSDLDVIAPTVTSIAIGSTPEGTAYVLDESVYIDVTFSENVFSTRNSDGAIGQVGIDIAGVTRDADYHRRRGGDTLRFRYRVVLGDVDAGGISIAENSLTLADGASLTDWRDNAAVLDHDALSDDADHAVNGPGGF